MHISRGREYPVLSIRPAAAAVDEVCGSDCDDVTRNLTQNINWPCHLINDINNNLIPHTLDQADKTSSAAPPRPRPTPTHTHAHPLRPPPTRPTIVTSKHRAAVPRRGRQCPRFYRTFVVDVNRYNLSSILYYYFAENDAPSKTSPPPVR